MHVPAAYLTVGFEDGAIERNTMSILGLLAEQRQKATFFVLGRIARDMPRLVRTIALQGHEVACHSFEHRRLYDFSRSEVKILLSSAKRYLEDVYGRPVVGFRAPDFSITQKNLWVFDLLGEAGFRYDSSVYPTGLHDVYGIKGFPRRPFRLPNGLVEIPMSVVMVGKTAIPFGGGGYLRMYPGLLTRACLRSLNRKGLPCVLYAHPFEMGDSVVRIPGMSLARRFRTYVGIQTVKRKLSRLLRDFCFLACEDYVDSVTAECADKGPTEELWA